MQATESIQHLDAETAREFLAQLPEHVRQAFLARAAEINYPVEAVLESAISYSLLPKQNSPSIVADVVTSKTGLVGRLHG